MKIINFILIIASQLVFAIPVDPLDFVRENNFQMEGLDTLQVQKSIPVSVRNSKTNHEVKGTIWRGNNIPTAFSAMKNIPFQDDLHASPRPLDKVVETTGKIKASTAFEDDLKLPFKKQRFHYDPTKVPPLFVDKGLRNMEPQRLADNAQSKEIDELFIKYGLTEPTEERTRLGRMLGQYTTQQVQQILHKFFIP